MRLERDWKRSHMNFGSHCAELARGVFVLCACLAATSALAQNDGTAVDLTASEDSEEPVVVETAPKTKDFDLEILASQFVEAPISGDARKAAQYGGRVDGYFRARASAIGGSSNLTLKVRPELRWGEDTIGEVGLIPSNALLFQTAGRGEFDLSASLEYKWDSGATLEVGKLNLLEQTRKIPIIASNGHIGFQNLAFVLPPSGVAPNTVTGAMLNVPTEKVIYRLWVFDVDSQYRRTGLEDPFENGVLALAGATFLPTIGGERGFYTAVLVGSTRDDFARDILPAALTPPPGGSFGDQSGEIAVQLSGYQFVETYPEARGKGWGIMARFQASAGDPTFLDWSAYLGVSGNPRFRPQDRFGIAAFSYSLTNELVDDIAFRLGIEDETGLEAFYTYQFHERFGLSANIQVVDSAIAARATGVTVGARLTSQF